MTLFQLFRRIVPYVKPHRFLLVATLSLTLVGSLLAQVNAVVLDRTVDAINALVGAPDFSWAKAARILMLVSIVLLGKEVLRAGMPIIFLDEPTASLDAIATEQIKSAIDAIKRDRTVIIISHSISQIIDSEMVYALQEGRIQQSGDPDTLYHEGGVYKDIVDASARSLNIEKLAQTISAV